MLYFLRNFLENWDILMINILRNKSDGFFAKFLLGIIALAMAITGMIGYMGSSSSVIFSSAGVDITAPALDKEIRRQISQMEKMSGRRINTKLAVQMGILNQIISNLSLRILLDREAKDSGILVRRDRVEAMIRAYPQLQDSNGEFDYQLFNNLLQSANISENEFVTETMAEKSRELIQSSLVNTFDVPEYLVKFNYMVSNEIRNVSSVVLNSDNNVITEKPKDSDLLELYETHKTSFKTPEYRKLSYFLITQNDVRHLIRSKSKDSDAMYKKMYDVAENITDDLISGSSLNDISKKYGINHVDLPKFDLIGNGVNRRKIKDKIFTDVYINKAISMGLGDVSSIEEIGNNLLVFKVTGFEEAKQKSFKEVRNNLIDIWKMNKKEDKTLNYISSIKQNIIKNKKSLSDSAKKYGLKVSNISIKRGQMSSIPIETVNAMFMAKVGEIGIKKETKNGQYRIYMVDNVVFPEKKNYKDEKVFMKKDLHIATLEEYVYYLREKYGFSVNENNLKSFMNMYLN